MCMADSLCHAPTIFNDIRNCFFFNINFRFSQINNFSSHLIPCCKRKVISIKLTVGVNDKTCAGKSNTTVSIE